MSYRKVCSETGCNRTADAAGGKKCAVHATIPMFGSAVESTKPAPKSETLKTSAFDRNRGAGSKDQPIFEGSNYLQSTILEVADRYGECWVDKLGSNGEVRRTCEAMFAQGLITPIPRVARQKRNLVRYQITPAGRAKLARAA